MMKIVRKDYMWECSHIDDDEEKGKLDKYGLSKYVVSKKLIFDSVEE